MQGTGDKRAINCQDCPTHSIHVVSGGGGLGLVLKVWGLTLSEWGVKLEARGLGVADAQDHLDIRLPAQGERRHQGQQVFHGLELIRTHTRLTAGASQQERGGGDGGGDGDDDGDDCDDCDDNDHDKNICM